MSTTESEKPNLLTFKDYDPKIEIKGNTGSKIRIDIKIDEKAHREVGKTPLFPR